MAGTSLFALLDDIAALLDDVAVMTKVATKKTAGVLGDDLALNAEQVSGVAAERELPVVWAVAKGSARNKVFLVPSALAISLLAPWLVTPLLMVGGAFLCFEGVEKIAHKALDRHAVAAEVSARRAAAADPAVDMVAFEQAKIRGAIRTDIVLSAEIIVISLGTIADRSFGEQVAVLVTIAVLMTVGVYGLVAAIVKLDDVGLALSRRPSAALRTIGGVIVRGAPALMKGLSIVGTAAMFMVGGGILSHGIGPIHRLSQRLSEGPLGWLLSTLLDAGVGVVAGIVLLALVSAVTRLRLRVKAP